MIKTHIANLVTLSRIALIPVLITLFLQDQYMLTLIVFSAAALTDGVDGYLARYLNQISPLGAWLDPVADKLIVISMFILLLVDNSTYSIGIPTILIVCREVMISALREWMATLGKHYTLKVSILSKCKTSVQMFAIFLFLLSKLHPTQTALLSAAYSIFYLATFLTFISLVDYVWNAWKAIQNDIDTFEDTSSSI